MTSCQKLIFGLGLLVSSMCCSSLRAQPNDDFRIRIGYYDLLAEYGSIEDGSGISASVVESDFDSDPAVYQYMPNTTFAPLAGITFVDGSGLHNSVPSSHSSISNRILAADMGVARGIDTVTVYEADDYINRILGFETLTDPAGQPFQVQNHSWAGDFVDDADAVNALRRFDYLIERDGISMAVGVLNGAQNHSDLLVHSYNSIAVGRVDGNHASNPTTINGAGRTKPDIVSSGTTSSTATAEVSSVLAVLHHKALNEGNADASRPETMKAVLMAGASKAPFADWDRTTSRPLDDVFGAGEVNLYNSYKILEGGETDGSASVPAGATIGSAGYDYGENIDADDSLFYNFEVGPNQEWRDLSILLTWNLQVTDADPDAGLFDPVAQPLADMSLRLYDSSGIPLGLLLDASLSPVDNVEHIYVASLGSGSYSIEVSSDLQTDFGIAWYARAVPEPGSALLWTLAGLAMLARRRRHR